MKKEIQKVDGCIAEINLPKRLMAILVSALGNIVSALGKVRRPGNIGHGEGLTALQAIL